MTGYDGLWEADLLREVVSVCRDAERVPASVVAAAKSAFSWRSVAAAIADLEFDSAVDDDDLVRVRDAGSERRLRFRRDRCVAELSVIDGGSRLIGRLDPPMPGSVVLRHPGRPDATTTLDPLGHFMFEELPRGAVSLLTVPTDPTEPKLQTEWVTI